MSDFDKEAEREKLRKKFARDEEKRADTRRMSELLLKGATMTNKHCNQCSDPLFRHDGQTFCPSCQAEGRPAQAESQTEPQAESAAAETQSDMTETQPEATPNRQPPVQTEAEANATQTSGLDQSTAPQAGRSSETASSLGERENKRQFTAEGADRGTAPTGGLTEARQSLTRTLTRFAREAEQTDDPRRARELLTAAHEAAATLAELE
jgi:uncharacterized Zn finger protein (UPF0148 family)